MFRYRCVVLLVLGISCLGGCGGGKDTEARIPVTGTIHRKKKPLTHADLYFIPIENTPGKGGRGRSDDAGKFTVSYNSGGEGLPAGKYRVAVSRRIMPDGSPVPADDETDPIESPARETLPKIFTEGENSPLTVTIESDSPITLKIDR